MRGAFVYIMTNRPNGTLYVGVTSELPTRVWTHRTGALPGFTRRYGCKTLVWFEAHETMASGGGVWRPTAVRPAS